MKGNFLVSGCCVVFLVGSVPCEAQTFGSLYPGGISSSAPTTQDPTIAKWLMTLPFDEGLPEERRGTPEGLTLLLDNHPLAGEIYYFASPTAPRSTPIAENVQSERPSTEGRSSVARRPASIRTAKVSKPRPHHCACAAVAKSKRVYSPYATSWHFETLPS